VNEKSDLSVRPPVRLIPLVASSGERNATVWRTSVCLSRRHTHRDLPKGSMRRGQCTFRPDNKQEYRYKVVPVRNFLLRMYAH